MSGDSSNAMHVALVASITADAALSALIDGRIVDWPTAEEEFPCVTVGDIARLPWNADDMRGSELNVTLHTWARGTDARPDARTIGEALTTLLDNNEGALTLAGHRVVLCESAHSQVIRDEASEAALGGITAHGLYRFRFLTVAED